MATKEIPIAGYGAKLLSRVEVAEGTMAFHFEKPSQFDFKPGQSADVTLFNPPETDSEGHTRTFWCGLALDNSPLVLRDVGSQEIYALDLQLP